MSMDTYGNLQYLMYNNIIDVKRRDSEATRLCAVGSGDEPQ